MKHLMFILIMVTCRLSLLAQEQPVTLEICLQKAEQQFPLLKQKALYGSIADHNQANIKTNFLPQANINGQASWQSDVTQVPIRIPTISIPTPSKDMYKLTLDVNQLIFDAGMTRRQEELEKINLELNRQGVDVELYKLKERVNQLFFGILLLRENEQLLGLTRKDIETRMKRIESSVAHGTMLATNLTVLKVQVLKIDQAVAELQFNQEALLKSMTELTGMPLTRATAFQLPGPVVNTDKTEVNRPEIKLFNLQQDRLTGLDKLTQTKTKPRLSGFGTLGYGRPGLNLLENQFKSYAMVGARLSWNLWDWHQNSNDRQVLGVQKSIIETQKESFNQNLRIALQNDLSEINKYLALIETDNQIIKLRSEITIATASQLDNGVVTSSEYLTEVNAELQAKLDLKTHEVKLVQARINYLTTLGN